MCDDCAGMAERVAKLEARDRLMQRRVAWLEMLAECLPYALEDRITRLADVADRLEQVAP